MKDLENIECGTLVYSGLLRDGGSAIVILNNNNQKIKIRIMRSLSERHSEFHNFIELSVDNKVILHVKSKDEIGGLNEFLFRNQDKIDQRFLAILALLTN
jgi:hypothetical protein